MQRLYLLLELPKNVHRTEQYCFQPPLTNGEVGSKISAERRGIDCERLQTESP